MNRLKVFVGIGIIAIGAIIIAAGISELAAHQKCIAEAQKIMSSPLVCQDNATTLFESGLGAKAVGVLILVFGLKDISFLALSKQ